MAIEIIRLERTSDDLRHLACRTDDAGQARRLLAIALVLDGSSRAAAAQAAGMDRQSLRDWVHRYNDEGVDGLCDRARSGRPALMSGDQLAEFDQMVEQGPDRQADGVVRWRCIDLKERIAARFGVGISERSVGRILNARGFSRLVPRPQHPKSDAAAQEAFKKTSRKQ